MITPDRLGRLNKTVISTVEKSISDKNLSILGPTNDFNIMTPNSILPRGSRQNARLVIQPRKLQTAMQVL